MKPELLNEDLMALPLSYSTYMPSLCLAGMACDNFFLSQQNTRMWVGDMVILFDQYSFLCLRGFWVSLFISNPQISQLLWNAHLPATELQVLLVFLCAHFGT